MVCREPALLGLVPATPRRLARAASGLRLIVGCGMDDFRHVGRVTDKCEFFSPALAIPMRKLAFALYDGLFVEHAALAEAALLVLATIREDVESRRAEV